jgi:hypothetical protein
VGQYLTPHFKTFHTGTLAPGLRQYLTPHFKTFHTGTLARGLRQSSSTTFIGIITPVIEQTLPIVEKT